MNCLDPSQLLRKKIEELAVFFTTKHVFTVEIWNFYRSLPNKPPQKYKPCNHRVNKVYRSKNSSYWCFGSDIVEADTPQNHDLLKPDDPETEF